MRKVEDGEKKDRRKKNKALIMATNVIASQPPKCRPTGMPHDCAKNVTLVKGDSK